MGQIPVGMVFYRHFNVTESGLHKNMPQGCCFIGNVHMHRFTVGFMFIKSWLIFGEYLLKYI